MKETASLWSATTNLPNHPALAADTEADLVIVGGGITGVTAAFLAAESNMRVLLVEARRIGGGVTSGTTAHLTEAIDTRYHQLARDFGKEGAKLAAESSRAAIEKVSAIVDTQAIACDFVRRPGYLFTENAKDVAELEKEHEAAAEAGLSVELMADAPLPFTTHAALRFPGQAQMHALRYLEGLARAARAKGAHLHEDSRVIAIDDGDRCTVHLENGCTVRAKNVFVATDAPLNRVFLQTKIHAYRSYVVAFASGGMDLEDALFWDTLDPYHYFSCFTVDGVPYLIVGGEDHKTGTSTDTDDRFAALAEWTRARFPVREPAYRWSAQVEEPVDGLPFIGRNSLSENVFVATGFSGNGTTFGTIAAQMVVDLARGRESRYAELYSATRVKPIAAAGAYTRENIDFPVHLLSDRLHPVEAKDVAEIAPGEGKTMRVHGERLGVYRDPKGSLHAVSCVCTHLGCLVKFNAAASSWDCPCHGSRFDVDGQVLHGPAVRPLAKKAPPSDGPRRA